VAEPELGVPVLAGSVPADPDPAEGGLVLVAGELGVLGLDGPGLGGLVLAGGLDGPMVAPGALDGLGLGRGVGFGRDVRLAHADELRPDTFT
jgi:hypothetical protein